MQITANFRILPFESISVKENFNIRQDYGDITALAASILTSGIKVPLRGYIKGTKFIITDGHRRHAALQQLRNEGKGLDIKVPFLLEEKGYTEEKRTFDLLLLNDGKKLTIMEEACLYQRIKNQFNLSNVDIAKKAGKSSMHVGNCLLLLCAPTELQQHVINEVVSASLIIEKLRVGESGDVILESINKALDTQVAETGTPREGKKVSRKHLEGAKAEKVTKVKVESVASGSEVEPTTITLDTALLNSLVAELGEFSDMSSHAATNTLKYILALGKGEIDKNAFISKMLNNLID